jgi:hypothetical protein
MSFKPTLRILLLTVALSLVAASAIARSAELIEPQRTEIVTLDNTKATTPTQVRRAIILGGARHGWKPIADKPGILTLNLSTREHEVTVDVLYDAQGFQVKFRSSANLNEQKSGDRITIHPKVNQWLSALNEDIRSAAVSGGSQSN